MHRLASQLFYAGILTALPVLSGTTSSAQTGEKPRQTIMLTDPTPRPPDLEQEYEGSREENAAAEHNAIILNAERQSLVTHASGDLAFLATTLKRALDTHTNGKPLAPEIQVAELIEKLSKNVRSALELGGQKAPPHAELKAKTEAPAAPASSAEQAFTQEIASESAKLVLLTQELQRDMTNSNSATVSVGAITRSAEIEILAKTLKEQLKKGA